MTFNPRWLEDRLDLRPALLLFDGHCAFCHASVRFAAMEDSHAVLRFATLDGPHGQALTTSQRQALGDTIVLIDADGHTCALQPLPASESVSVDCGGCSDLCWAPSRDRSPIAATI